MSPFFALIDHFMCINSLKNAANLTLISGTKTDEICIERLLISFIYDSSLSDIRGGGQCKMAVGILRRLTATAP